MALSNEKTPDDDEEDVSDIATKLPIKQMIAIFFCQMNEATQITMPYTIAVYMVQDYLGPQASQAQISTLTGILPIVIMSNISSLISVLGFGSSTTYLSALLTRMSGGLCNFTFGCLKSMIGESMDLPTQALALGYLSLAWGFGTILGPSLGGALATPCQAYGSSFPLCQPGQLFDSRPFLLPCISAAFISFLALQSSMFLLKETLPSKVTRKYARIQQSDEEQGVKLGFGSTKGIGLSELSKEPTAKSPRQVRRGDSAGEMYAQSYHKPTAASPRTATIDELRPMAGTVGIELAPQSLALLANASSELQPAEDQQPQQVCHDSANMSDAAMPSVGQQSLELSSISHHADLPLHNLPDGDDDHPATANAEQVQQSSEHDSDRPHADHDPEHESDDEHAVLIAASEDELHDESQQGPSPVQKKSRQQGSAADRQRIWYNERAVQLTILGYGSIAFLYNFVDELTPLFAAAPPAIGGVGLLASQLAVPLVFCGVVLMIYAVYGYPWFQRTYGAKVSCRLGLIATAPFVLLIPIAHYFSWSVMAAQLTLCAILGFKSMGASNSFSGSMILVNNAAPRHALGKVNGAGQMVASFVRAIGPAMAGIIWGSTTQLQLPGKQFLPFAFVSVVALLTQLVYVFVKLPLSDR